MRRQLVQGLASSRHDSNYIHRAAGGRIGERLVRPPLDTAGKSANGDIPRLDSEGMATQPYRRGVP